MSSPSSPVLQRLCCLDRSSPDFQDQLSNVLYGQEYRQYAPSLQSNDLVWLVEYLDKALDDLDPSYPASRKCLRELRTICGKKAMLPMSYTLSSDLLVICPHPFASGGYSDVYHGTLDNSRVCVKRVRMYLQDGPQKATKAFCQEAVIWKRLRHLNILPLLGVTISPLQLISDWMPGGDLSEYIKTHPDADRLGLLSDVAKGLKYLHSCNVVHGDLKGPNVLVDNSGRARIADFGLATVAQNLDSMRTTSRQHGHSARWAAPEILKEQGAHSKKADIFAFAMVMIEVFTGAVPFSNRSSFMAIFAIMQGERPPRPTHPAFTEELWTLMQDCWVPEPHLRPEVSEALQVLLTPPLALERLRCLDRSSPEFQDQLNTVLCGKEYQQCTPNLQGSDLVWLVEYLDEALDDLDPSCDASRKCLHELRRICGTRMILPPSYTLSSDLLEVHPNPFGSGSGGDVHHGTLSGSKVCVKRIRAYTQDESQNCAQFLCREAVIWKRLRHLNILPLLGVTITPPQLISDWMTGGDLLEYIKTHPDADRLGLLSDIAKGLCYLHSCNVVHGDLKGPNILVDDSGHARIADFGLAMVTQNLDSTRATPCQHGHSARWAAPEILSEQGTHSRKADVFAFAMVMIEVFTGTVPFSSRSSFMAIFAIMQGDRPPRPTHPAFTDELWALMQNCWAPEPQLRPEVSEALQILLTPPLTLERLYHLNTSSPDFHDQLRSILCGQAYAQCVLNLQRDDLARLVEYFDKTLDDLDPSCAASRKCLYELRSICGTRMILPPSYTLSSDLLEIHPNPFGSGSGGDVYHGTLGGSKIRIKRVRGYTQDELQDCAKIFCQEAVIWKHLTHPNILPLLGVTITPPQLISDWMSGGDLSGYIKEYPNANRLRLSSDIAAGLEYLHSRDVIHRDLKGQNVLVDDSGHARIADFGLATVAQTMDSIRSTSHHDCSSRWTAPEILNGGPHNKQTDIFSFAMIMIEIFTGTIPFNNYVTIAAMLAVAKGERPPRPVHPTFTDTLWTLTQRCWDHTPHLRPEISEALEVLLIPDDPAWKRLIGDTLSTHERISLIVTIFSDHDQVESVGQLSGDDAQTFADIICGALDSLEPEIRRKCLRCLYKICGHQALVPQLLEIPLCYDPSGYPLYQGAFSDMWKGQHNGMGIAAKVLRVYSSSDLERTRKSFCKEVVAWRALRHPNVLPLLGVTMAENLMAMVSEWMAKGNINDFLNTNANADRLGLLRDATTGLIYMHDQGIIHGNLKGTNILINNDGRACVADFGLLRVISDDLTLTTTAVGPNTAQWTSPELLVPQMFGLKESHSSKESDCYALGMTIYEVLSGQKPFSEYSLLAVASKVLEGERPTRPQGAGGVWFTDDIWAILERCWKPYPSDRVIPRAVLLCLEGSPPTSRPSSDVGGLGGGATNTNG